MTSLNNPTDPSHMCKTPNECVEHYDFWAKSYDSDVVDLQYNGSELLVEICLEFLPERNLKILDFLCGTGSVGSKLSSCGYQYIDGIDGSKNMLEICRKTAVYKNLYQETLTPQSTSEKVAKNFYDAVVCVGAFSPGHIDGNYFHHLYEATKKNGFIIFGVRLPWLESLNLQVKIDKIEEDKIWRLITKQEKANYRENVPGIFYVFEKL